MSKLKVLIHPVTPFQQNAPILYCDESKKCAFVDPGGDIDILLGIAKDNNLIPEKIFLTHGHIDHAGAAAELARILSLEIEGPHKEDLFLLESLEEQGKMLGMECENCIPDRWLNEGDEIKLANENLKVLFCPGHSPGHVVFYHPESKMVIIGDVLFRGSVGRTDLPRGDHQTLINSITEKLWPLGDEILFIPGHGPTSTFGQERKDNAFVADKIISQV
tara:strand:+ start:152 stop:808 length:657 start_codon:yes stop_codon:yes gene_type:complete